MSEQQEVQNKDKCRVVCLFIVCAFSALFIGGCAADTGAELVQLLIYFKLQKLIRIIPRWMLLPLRRTVDQRENIVFTNCIVFYYMRPQECEREQKKL